MISHFILLNELTKPVLFISSLFKDSIDLK